MTHAAKLAIITVAALTAAASCFAVFGPTCKTLFLTLSLTGFVLAKAIFKGALCEFSNFLLHHLTHFQEITALHSSDLHILHNKS